MDSLDHSLEIQFLEEKVASIDAEIAAITKNVQDLTELEGQRISALYDERKKYGVRLQKLRRQLIAHDDKQQTREDRIGLANKFYDELDNLRQLPYMRLYLQVMDKLAQAQKGSTDPQVKAALAECYGRLDAEDFVDRAEFETGLHTLVNKLHAMENLQEARTIATSIQEDLNAFGFR